MNQSSQLSRRLKIIEGQVRGVRELVAKNAYCVDVITQSSAIKQALSRVEDLILKQHLSHCVVRQIKNGQASQAVDEVLKVYQLKRR
jgi:DNA-binding FrmR family transcriptional regulator